ncbi:thioredoxin domain-containing protein [Subtercola sp. YIM 133946]|uniref:thioredoxin domain-containing protein n=1 Tax=Subtercola sp. YIM 133946 TaxID=3118909 RepID=UPI002F933B8D
MANRLAQAISPYLRSHADNPVDWFPWGEAAFDEAVRRDVPVLVSIGYSTCHWCHVMARESFSDPVLAARLNEQFVAVKVDREEHPEVDAFYLAAAAAFTQNLGWPLNVFVTPQGRPFFAGTYSPPVPVQGVASFSQVLDAVIEAWRLRRSDVEQSAAAIVEALSAPRPAHPGSPSGNADDPNAAISAGGAGGADAADDARDPVPSRAEFDRVIAELEAYEDTVNGGFGGAPKFPVAPVLGFLSTADAPLALRTLEKIAASDLRDPVEGGFFRYATRANWSEPHYERMLYDNALLLDVYTTAATKPAAEPWAAQAAAGVAGFLLDVLQIDGGGFASAQDSESLVDGRQSEGGYYALDAAARAFQPAPKLDAKILTGWNGLAIAALARAGAVFGEQRWVAAAVAATEYLLARHRRADGTLLRASLGERTSDARATLEDYGMFATALGRLATVTGDPRYAALGRALLDAVTVPTPAASDTVPSPGVADAAAADSPASTGAGDAPSSGVAEAPGASRSVFAVPGGGDPVLAARGLVIEGDVSEGAYPSGVSALATAAIDLAGTTGDGRYADLAVRALAPVAADALSRPIGFGTALEQLYRLRQAAAD